MPPVVLASFPAFSGVALSMSPAGLALRAGIGESIDLLLKAAEDPSDPTSLDTSAVSAATNARDGLTFVPALVERL